MWPLHQIYSDAGDARLGGQGLHDGRHRLPRMQAAGDRRDHPRAGSRSASARSATSTTRSSCATSSPTAASARASWPRKRCATCATRWGSTTLSVDAALDLAHPSPDAASRVARVYGEPLLELPHDLYIPPEALEVFLDTFEGPLDLLLYLIRKQNINVLDIPMAELTRQYLGYVEMMRRTQLELAAEYLLMAAVLIEIKSRLLLPKPPAPPGAEPEDPRAELVRRLLEYERMKQAAREIDALPLAERDFATGARLVRPRRGGAPARRRARTTCGPPGRG